MCTSSETLLVSTLWGSDVGGSLWGAFIFAAEEEEGTNPYGQCLRSLSCLVNLNRGSNNQLITQLLGRLLLVLLPLAAVSCHLGGGTFCSSTINLQHLLQNQGSLLPHTNVIQLCKYANFIFAGWWSRTPISSRMQSIIFLTSSCWPELTMAKDWGDNGPSNWLVGGGAGGSGVCWLSLEIFRLAISSSNSILSWICRAAHVDTDIKKKKRRKKTHKAWIFCFSRVHYNLNVQTMQRKGK